MNKKYRANSWLDPRIEVRDSEIHGKESFAQTLIRAGEVVIIWGGKLFTIEEAKTGKAKQGTIAAIAENMVLAAPADTSDGPDQYLNHSCHPDLWMKDEVRLTARRDILPGDELTADYAMWEWDENWIASWICNCGTALCRETITGKDWRLSELQKRYRHHFSPFLNERVGTLR
jgi:SET domain-containing protein